MDALGAYIQRACASLPTATFFVFSSIKRRRRPSARNESSIPSPYLVRDFDPEVRGERVHVDRLGDPCARRLTAWDVP